MFKETLHYGIYKCKWVHGLLPGTVHAQLTLQLHFSKPVQALAILNSLKKGIQALYIINCKPDQSTMTITAYSQVPIYTWVQ